MCSRGTLICLSKRLKYCLLFVFGNTNARIFNCKANIGILSFFYRDFYVYVPLFCKFYSVANKINQTLVYTSGIRAYCCRQVHELGFAANRTQGHITSLNPLRPENAPDSWEKQALQAFEQGLEEIVSLAVIDGNEYLRFMRPMITEKGCLKCHAHQGYQVGDTLDPHFSMFIF